MEYLKNPNLETIKQNYLGNPCLSGRFLNYAKVKVPSARDILKWRLSRAKKFFTTTNNSNITQDYIKINEVTNESIRNDKLDSIIWLGHATFLITINNKKIIIDPVLGNIITRKRLAPLPCSIESLDCVDYLLISHAHYDHLDESSIKQLANLNPNLITYCGLNHSSIITKCGVKNIVEASWYQKYPINNDEIEFYFLPALHWSRRGLNDTNRRLWGSFLIKCKNKTIYFMGDSGYSEHFKEIGELFNGVDTCLLGIGAYEPRDIMKSSHINPQEALQAFNDLKGKTLIPMHYGTFHLADEPRHEPPELISLLWKDNNQSGNLKISKIGEIIPI